MARTIPILLLLCAAFASCESIKKTVRETYKYEMYIDYKYISYQGQNSTQSLYLEIDSTNQIWYTGKLIINNSDTFLLRGFEKGSHYVTTYRRPNSQNYGGLSIWCRGDTGMIRDSLSIENRQENRIIKERTILYRQPRKTCNK